MSLNLPPPTGASKPIDTDVQYVVGIPPRLEKRKRRELPCEPVAGVPPPDTETWKGMLHDTLVYPFRKDGWYVLVPGLALGFVTFFGVFIAGRGLAFFLGLFAAHYMVVMESTIIGEDNPPGWPSISDFLDDIATPLTQVLSAIIVSCVPWGIFEFTMADNMVDPTFVRCLCVVAAGCYFPMSLLSVSFHGSIRSLLPDYVVPAIMRAFPGYLVVVACLLLVTLGGLVCMAVGGFYFLICHARLTGLVYRRYQQSIGCSVGPVRHSTCRKSTEANRLWNSRAQFS